MSILNSNLPPSGNFYLRSWKLTLPFGDPKPTKVKEKELANGYESEYFYTANDGGLVCKVANGTPSVNSVFARTELREYLRDGDTSIKAIGVTKNNWVTSAYPKEIQALAGAVDGSMTVDLAVNSVSTTGNPDQVGRIVIGQIHSGLSIPVRLCYRLLPGHTKGSLYFYHRQRDGNGKTEKYYPIVGSRANDAQEPEDGIALNERFKYTITLKGNLLSVTLIRDNKLTLSIMDNISDSEYHTPYVNNNTESFDFMFFKVGVYNQSNSTDYAQATFYQIQVDH